MSALRKKEIMNEFGTTTIDGTFGDIVLCALNNDFPGVDRILSYDNTQINAQKAESGVTALMAASGRGLDRMVLHLLSKEGVDTSVVDHFGKDALGHGRLFPRVVGLIMEHRNPGLKWSEPDFRPV